MANAIKYEAVWNSRSTVLTTELDALGDGSRSNAGSEINNGSNLDQYGKLELSVDFVSAPGAGAYVDVYMIAALDNTNYEDGSASVDPGAHNRIASIPIKASTAAQRIASRVFPLHPSKVKFLLENRTGQAFPASGSTLTLYTTNDEVQ